MLLRGGPADGHTVTETTLPDVVWVRVQSVQGEIVPVVEGGRLVVLSADAHPRETAGHVAYVLRRNGWRFDSRTLKT